MSRVQSPIASTTPDALRASIAEAVQVDAQQLQAAVGSIQVATSDQLQVTDPQIKSLYDAGSRTLTLLADRIPAGQEAQAFAEALVQHLGRQAAVDLLGEEGVANGRKLPGDVMKVTTLADGTQLQYVKVTDPLGMRWISSADSLLTTNRPEYALGLLPRDAMKLYYRLLDAGYKGLSLTNALPNPDGYISKNTDPNEFLLAQYELYAKDVAEGDPMVFDDWLAGSDLPEIVEARELAKVQERQLSNVSDTRQPIAGAEGVVMAKLRDVSGGLDVIERALAVASTGDLSQAPFPLAGDSARIHLNAQTSAYLHVLEMCSAQTLKEWLMSEQASMASEEEVLAKLQDVALGLEVIEAALKKCSEGDLAQAPFPLVGENARIHLSARSAAYLHALEMCNASTVQEFLKETHSLDVESSPATRDAYSGEWQLDIRGPGISYTGTVVAVDPRDALSRGLTTKLSNGQIVGNAFAVPVDIIQEAPGNFDVSFATKAGDLSIQVVRAEHAAGLAKGAEKLAAIGAKEPAVYLLAEFSWDDDAYGEHVPVAGLYRVTESTLQRMDNIVGLVESNELSPSGASVLFPSRDVALLSCVAFSDDNTLATVPEFFDPKIDRLVYLCDVANIEIDLERADYRDACELYAEASAIDQNGNFAGIHVSSNAEVVGGVAISADGQTGVWRMHGFLDSWSKVRNQIEAHLDQQKAVGRNVDVPSIDDTLAGRKLVQSLRGDGIKLSGDLPATPEQSQLVNRLNAAVSQAVDAALDAGLARIQSELGTVAGDRKEMHVAGAAPANALGAMFRSYLIDEVERVMESSKTVAQQSEGPSP